MKLALGAIPLWLTSLLYLGCYVPYIMITRLLATTKVPELQRPLTGLSIGPRWSTAREPARVTP